MTRKNFRRALEVKNISRTSELNDKVDTYFLTVTQWNMTWQCAQNCSISTNSNSWIFSYHKTPMTEQDVKYKHNRITTNYTAKWIYSLSCFYIILEGHKKKILRIHSPQMGFKSCTSKIGKSHLCQIIPLEQYRSCPLCENMALGLYGNQAVFWVSKRKTTEYKPCLEQWNWHVVAQQMHWKLMTIIFIFLA